MTETLLSQSSVLLFGRKMTDLAIVEPDVTAPTDVLYATTHHYDRLYGHRRVDGYPVAATNRILVKNQKDLADNGIYVVRAADETWQRAGDALNINMVVRATGGRTNRGRHWVLISEDNGNDYPKVFVRRPRDPRKRGSNRHLEVQLSDDACFARIYGFSYEGTYYDLPRPALFLVHGDGEDVTKSSAIAGPSSTAANLARAPGEPSLTGLAAADFEFADNLKVWSYDKDDHTIRMDVEAGMFEQVLLDAFLGGGGPGVSGARVSGARVSGARVSGARVSGARLSGGSGD